MRVSLLRLALLSFVALSCRSTEPSADATFTGDWMGNKWEGEATAVLVTHGGTADTLYIWGKQLVEHAQARQEVILARVEFHGVGRYPLDGDDVRLNEIVGGDVLSVSYQGTGTAASVLEITSYGGSNGVIEGTLTFEAYRVGTMTRPLLGFANGRFRAVVITQ